MPLGREGRAGGEDHHQAGRSTAGTPPRRTADRARPAGRTRSGFDASVPRPRKAVIRSRIASTALALLIGPPHDRLHRRAKHLAPVFVVLEHVEAGTRGRQHHRITGLGQGLRRRHRLLHTCPPGSPATAPASASAMRSAASPITTAARPVPCNAAAQRRVTAALVPPAGDQHHRPGEPGQRRHHRAHVGALRIVEERDPVALSDQGHPVRQRRESPAASARPPGGWRPAAGSPAPRPGRFPGCGARTARANWPGSVRRSPTGQAQAQRIALDPTAFAERLRGRKRHHHAGQLRRQRRPPAHRRRSPRRSRRAFWLLEHARLGRGVTVDAVVAVEVIGGDVQQDGDPGLEALDGLQLKARHLDHHDASRTRPRR